MSIKLYWGSGSQPAWRVMLALYFKELEYDDQLLSFSDREHKSEKFLAINPRGMVPTLVDGDVIMTESVAIMAYLDQAYPDRPIFGDSPASIGQTWSTLLEIENYLLSRGMKVVRALFFGRVDGNEDTLREDLDKMADELDRLDGLFADPSRPWDAIDCMMVPAMASLLRASTKDGADKLGLTVMLGQDRWGNLLRRLEDAKKLPGIARTWPPHWGDM